jgi:hypothetical protein
MYELFCSVLIIFVILHTSAFEILSLLRINICSLVIFLQAKSKIVMEKAKQTVKVRLFVGVLIQLLQMPSLYYNCNINSEHVNTSTVFCVFFCVLREFKSSST